MATQCIQCLSFAYVYDTECVVTCPSDRPYESSGYCTDCVGVGFCAVCGTDQYTSAEICTQCVYPYVLF